MFRGPCRSVRSTWLCTTQACLTTPPESFLPFQPRLLPARPLVACPHNPRAVSSNRLCCSRICSSVWPLAFPRLSISILSPPCPLKFPSSPFSGCLTFGCWLIAPSINPAAPPSLNLLIALIVSIAACNVLLALKFFLITGNKSPPSFAFSPRCCLANSSTKGCERASCAVMRCWGSMVKQRFMNSRAERETERQYSRGVKEKSATKMACISSRLESRSKGV